MIQYVLIIYFYIKPNFPLFIYFKIFYKTNLNFTFKFYFNLKTKTYIQNFAPLI